MNEYDRIKHQFPETINNSFNQLANIYQYF